MSFTISGLSSDVAGSKSLRKALATFSNSYATGGETITAAQLGLNVIEFIDVEDSEGYTYDVDIAAGGASAKIVVYRSSGATPSGSISAITPSGSISNDASIVKAKYLTIDPSGITVPNLNLVYNADPVTNLSASQLYVYRDSEDYTYNLMGFLAANQNGTANTTFTSENNGGVYVANTRATGFVKHDLDPASNLGGIAIFVDEADGYKLKANTGFGDIYVPLKLSEHGAGVILKIIDADTSGMKELYYDDNGADNAKLCFVATDTSDHDTTAEMLSIIGAYGNSVDIGQAQAQSASFTGDAVTPTFTGVSGSAGALTQVSNGTDLSSVAVNIEVTGY